MEGSAKALKHAAFIGGKKGVKLHFVNVPDSNIDTDIMVAARKLGTASLLSDEEKVAQEKKDKDFADDVKFRKKAIGDVKHTQDLGWLSWKSFLSSIRVNFLVSASLVSH